MLHYRNVDDDMNEKKWEWCHRREAHRFIYMRITFFRSAKLFCVSSFFRSCYLFVPVWWVYAWKRCMEILLLAPYTNAYEEENEFMYVFFFIIARTHVTVQWTNYTMKSIRCLIKLIFTCCQPMYTSIVLQSIYVQTVEFFL